MSRHTATRYKLTLDEPGRHLLLSNGTTQLDWNGREKLLKVKSPSHRVLSRTITIAFSEIEYLALEIDLRGPGLLQLRLLLRYKDRRGLQASLEQPLCVENLDQEEEALDLLFRIAHTMGWEGYRAQRDERFLFIELAPEVLTSHPYRAGQAPTREITPPTGAADYKLTNPAVGDMIGGCVLQEWDPGTRISLVRPKPTLLPRALRYRALLISSLAVLSWILTLLLDANAPLFGLEGTGGLHLGVLGVWVFLAAGYLMLCDGPLSSSEIFMAITVDWPSHSIWVLSGISARRQSSTSQQAFSLQSENPISGLRVRQKPIEGYSNGGYWLELLRRDSLHNEPALLCSEGDLDGLEAVGAALSSALKVPLYRYPRPTPVRSKQPAHLAWWSPLRIGLLAAIAGIPLMALTALQWRTAGHQTFPWLLPTWLALVLLSLEVSRADAVGAFFAMLLWSLVLGLLPSFEAPSAFLIALGCAILAAIIASCKESEDELAALFSCGFWLSLVGAASALLSIGGASYFAVAVMALGALSSGLAFLKRRSLLWGGLLGCQVLALGLIPLTPHNAWTRTTQCNLPTLLSVWGSDPDSVYVIGQTTMESWTKRETKSVIFRTQDRGETWTPIWLGSELLRAVGGSAADIYAVGDGGAILHSADRGETWQPQQSGTQINLHALWVSPSGEVYLVGDAGAILHTADRGEHWEPLRSPAIGDHLLTVWGLSSAEVYVAGQGPRGPFDSADGSQRYGSGASAGIFRSIDGGKTWEREAIPPGVRVSAITGTANGLFAVGAETGRPLAPGVLLQRKEAGQWEPSPMWFDKFDFSIEPTSDALLGAWAASDDVLYFFNDYKLYRNSYGGSIAREKLPIFRIYALWGSEVASLYLVGLDGRIFIKTAQAWREQVADLSDAFGCPSTH